MESNSEKADREKKVSHSFQVNLGGVIELLSQHLYSGPHVYLRELLQNATDAIAARKQLGFGEAGEIQVELIRQKGGASTLVFEDNGIGLTEDEVHRFLATIGASSKRGSLPSNRDDFIGQFGIGLLSGFMVSHEIVMVTQSVKKGSPALEWRGRSDGTYSLRTLADSGARAGTRVFLRAKTGAEEYFEAEYVRHHLQNFGGFLPHRIEFAAGDSKETLNDETAPWEEATGSTQWRENCLKYGEKAFNQRFLDCFPLSVEKSGIHGVAYVLPASPSLAARRADRIYLKQMLLSESADDLLPEWAFFVRCVINTTALNPNASREAIQDDQDFASARDCLANCVRGYLRDLARNDQERLQRLIGLHFRSIKVLASDDDEFYRLFIDWLPFETSQGHLAMGKIRSGAREILYVSNIDGFRQMAPVAAAQGVFLINAGYVCDVDLVEKLVEVHPELSVRRIEPGDLMDSLEELPEAEEARLAPQMELVSRTLDRFGCDVLLRSFRPVELTAIYSLSEEGRFFGELERTKAKSSELWQGLLDGVGAPPSVKMRGTLCLNWRNPAVQKILSVRQKEIFARAAEMLYIQALLQGHFPLGVAEHRLLGEGLTALLELAVRGNHE